MVHLGSTRASAVELERETPLRAVVEHSPDGILLTAPDGRILDANPTACALLGRTEEETCAAGRAGVVVPDDAAERLLEERRRTGCARGILTLRRKDGTTFLADLASTVFKSATGELWTSMTFRDVTESERGRRALEILADAGRILASSLDLRTTLKHLTDLVVPRLADVCTVDLVEPEGVTPSRSLTGTLLGSPLSSVCAVGPSERTLPAVSTTCCAQESRAASSS
jgi:PAS domain S-box-containing protein